MFWKCGHCGTDGLLGKDHRHCPNCGAAQEENMRYFPSEGNMVVVHGYKKSGPDWECEFCGSPNGDKFCISCGAPKGNSKTVHVRDSIPSTGQGETANDAKLDWELRKARQAVQQANEILSDSKTFEDPEIKPSDFIRYPKEEPAFFEEKTQDFEEEFHESFRGRIPLHVWLWIGGGALLVFVIAVLTCTRTETLEVTQSTWVRTISIEKKSALQNSEWCDDMPFDAYSVSRRSRFHHNNKVQVGETCTLVKGFCVEVRPCKLVDHGDGVGSEVCTEKCTSDRTECVPKYKDDPIYEDWCSYTVDRWTSLREDKLEGNDFSPRWPNDPRTCDDLGCLRRAGAYERYSTSFRDEENRGHTCNFSEEKWRTFMIGTTWNGTIGAVFHDLHCGSLVSPS